MINAGELRIGNWVATSGFEEKLYKKITTNDFGKILYKFYFPIPLTPEILEKAGFTKTVSGRNLLLILFGFEFEYFDGINIIIESQWLPISHIKYLHQFQNLFHSLTGQDLQIEL